MANSSIYAAFERMWQHINIALAKKSDTSHSHSLSDDTIEGVAPMSKGGTEATDGATGLANLFAAGATVLSENQYGETLPEVSAEGRMFLVPDDSITIVKVWENADTTSDFVAQTIELDLSEYDMVILCTQLTTSNTVAATSVIKVGTNFRHIMQANLKASSSMKAYGREVEVSETGITFTVTTGHSYSSDSYSTDNTYNIPTHIYGIKGVITE